jgi:coatomer protein complex subunit alpha (xenin)
LIDEKESHRVFPAPGGKILVYRNGTPGKLELFDPLTKSEQYSVDYTNAKYAKYHDQYLIV